VSGNILSVYEFDSLKNTKIVPYIEGGVGLIYADFQRPDQGLRLILIRSQGWGCVSGLNILLFARIIYPTAAPTTITEV